MSTARSTVDDYAERTEATAACWKGMNGQQGGDPAKLAAALIQLAGQHEPPMRFPAGADAVGVFKQKAKDLLAQADTHRGLSMSPMTTPPDPSFVGCNVFAEHAPRHRR